LTIILTNISGIQGKKWILDINMRAIEEVANAFKQVEDSIVIGTDSDRRGKGTSTPTRIALVDWTWNNLL